MPPGTCPPGSATVAAAGAAMSNSPLPLWGASLRPTLPCSNIRAPCRLLFGQFCKIHASSQSLVPAVPACVGQGVVGGLFLPDRLAPDRPLGPVRPRPGPLPGLRPAAWRDRAPPGRRPLVGRGTAGLAGRQGPQASLARPGGGRCAGPDDQGGAGGGPPRPRPGPLRAAAPQRQGTLPALPPAA